MRDYVDEEDYPPSQEYFLYADSQVHTSLSDFSTFQYCLNMYLFSTNGSLDFFSLNKPGDFLYILGIFKYILSTVGISGVQFTFFSLFSLFSIFFIK